MLLLSMWLGHTGLYSIFNIRSRTLNLNPLSPRALTNVLSVTHMILPGVASPVAGLLYIHDEKYIMDSLNWIWYAYAHKLYSAYAASQPVSSAILHATPVESGRCLVGSRGVAIILPTTLTTKHQLHLIWQLSPSTQCPFQVIVTVGDGLIWSSWSLGRSSRATQCRGTTERTAGSISVISSCSSLLINSQRSPESYIYIHLLRRSLFKLIVPLNSCVYLLFLMSSQQEQTVVQAASDAYVAAHPRGIALWDQCNTSVSSNYNLIASFGRHNACVRVLANSPISSTSLWQPANPVRRSAIHMAKEVETGDSALLACAICDTTVHLGTNNLFLFKLYITSGIFLLCFLLIHIYDIVVAVSQEPLLDTAIYSVLGHAMQWPTPMLLSSQLSSVFKVRHTFSSTTKW